MSAPVTVRSSMTPQSAHLGAVPTSGMGTSRYLCFGGFQLDTQRELLVKDGTKMRLPGKVFQTLAALLEKPGEVVTREALRERLALPMVYVSHQFEEVLRLATTYCYRVVKVFPQFYFHIDRVMFAAVGFGPQNVAIVVSRKS